MTAQFSTPNFARGVKLCIEHVYPTLADLQAAAAIADIARSHEQMAPCRIMWNTPWIGAESAEGGDPLLVWPFNIPPFQQLFERATLADPDYPVTLRELSLSWDQRAEPLGITSPGGTGNEGELTDPNMARYTLTVRLFEKQPSTLAGTNPMPPRQVLRLDLDGEAAFGNDFARLNPFILDTLNISLDPFKVYFWQLECPGLFDAAGVPPGATVDQLAIPNLTLVATILTPLTVRDRVTDFAPPGIQNMPSKHGGTKAGTPIALTIPVVDAIITGDDVQTALGVFDEVARERMPSGYGVGHGAVGNVMQAADAPPAEMLEKDAYLSVIMVPMWHGQRHNSIRAADVPTAGLPFAPDPFVPPWITPTMDRRIVRVPSNFVVHHVFAVWNNYSPPSAIAGHVAYGIAAVSATYGQRIGVGIQTGFRGDDYLYQMVAFANFVGAPAPAPLSADNLELDAQEVVFGQAGYRLLNVPLVNPVAPLWNANTWQASGRPFFVGDANTTTAARSTAGVLPSAFGGGAFGTPVTQGKETALEVRWEKSDPIVGLDGGPPNAVRIGQGGEWVILVGRQTVAA